MELQALVADVRFWVTLLSLIHNITVKCSVSSSHGGEPMRMRHVWRAARATRTAIDGTDNRRMVLTPGAQDAENGCDDCATIRRRTAST
jgi:hypothetical protein